MTVPAQRAQSVKIAAGLVSIYKLELRYSVLSKGIIMLASSLPITSHVSEQEDDHVSINPCHPPLVSGKPLNPQGQSRLARGGMKVTNLQNVFVTLFG